jgi:hypothetical protein
MKIVTPEEVGFSSQRLARINRKMQRYVDENKLAGISTLIARRGKVVHFEQCGMADLDAGKPMATLPRCCSIAVNSMACVCWDARRWN